MDLLFIPLLSFVSLTVCNQWKEEIDTKVQLPNGNPLPVVLLGNKIDLDDAEVDKTQLDRFCEEKGFVGWFDTSAKLNINIDKAAKFLVEKILEHKEVFQKKKEAQATFQVLVAHPTLTSDILVSNRCAPPQPGMGNKGASNSGCC